MFDEIITLLEEGDIDKAQELVSSARRGTFSGEQMQILDRTFLKAQELTRKAAPVEDSTSKIVEAAKARTATRSSR